MKCNLSVLRLTPLLTLMSLPLVITRLLCFHKREHPPSTLTAPLPEAVVLASFPIAWFFGFLYSTEVPSLVSVILTITYATKGKHWLAALVCLHFPLLSPTAESSTTDPGSQRIVWCFKLHISSDQRCLGVVRICCKSTHVSPVPEGSPWCQSIAEVA